MAKSDQRGRWIAIVTGAFSVIIGLLYLIMITALDFRGQMLPPPSEAYGEGATVSFGFLEEVQPPV